jgi:hypothetical protein
VGCHSRYGDYASVVESRCGKYVGTLLWKCDVVVVRNRWCSWSNVGWCMVGLFACSCFNKHIANNCSSSY